MIKRWWLCWLGLGMLGSMLVLGMGDWGWIPAECGNREDPQSLLLFLGGPASCLAIAAGLLWARLFRELRSQPIRAFGLIACLLIGLVGLVVPVLALVLAVESNTMGAALV